MRSDNSLPRSFREEKIWKKDPKTGADNPALERLTHYYGPDYHRHSYSGYERNKFYLNLEGRTFADLSAISGADNIADSRSWCALDFDRDGWTDLAMVNANTPLLNLYRNRIGERSQNKFLKIRLVGGAQASGEKGSWSNRDGVGAAVEVKIGSRTIRRVRQLGEGYAAQNSAVLIIGLGGAESVDWARVSWPSGKTSEIAGPIAAERELIVREGLE